MNRQDFILACAALRRYIAAEGPVTLKEITIAGVYVPGGIDQLLLNKAIWRRKIDGMTCYSTKPLEAIEGYDVKADLSYENQR